MNLRARIDASRGSHWMSPLLLWALLAATSADAMGSEASAALPEAPTVELTSIEGSAPPRIDGDVSDAIWQRAKPLQLRFQTEPQSLVEASERTDVWVLFDRRSLYVAFYMHESEPGRIAVTTMARDTPLRNDDAVRILIDPRLTRREGYMFSVNPAGSRMDALIPAERQQDVLYRWNMLWKAKSRRVADGWTAEFEIPFRGLSYDAANGTWGFDIVRQIRRKGETMRWAPAPLGARQVELAYAGTMSGLHDLSQGRGLDLQLYGKLATTRNWPTGGSTAKGTPSATLYYKLTPSLTGLLTANTDFSDKPLDTRQVNTTRFSLFEPETREFFLEDADAFEFGNFGNGSAANGRPFFSRNIGLVKGRVVNLDVGGKLSGDIGGMRVGALSVRTGADPVAPAQTLSVLRVSKNVLDESRLGAIVTSGDPTGSSHNQVAGIDFRYRRSDILPGKRLDAVAYAERSFSDRRPDDWAYGLSLDLPNEPLQATARFSQIGRDFQPALGFVNRPGVRLYEGQVTLVRRPRESRLRSVKLAAFEQMFTGLDSRLQSRDDRVSLTAESVTNAEFQAGIDNYVETVDAPFTLANSLLVPAGHYQFVRGYASIESSNTRPLSASLKVTCCQYYGGSSTETDFELGYRPGPKFTLAFKHRLQPIRLPTGRTTIHIESLSTTLNFSPDMRLVSELQYDNVSQRFGGLLRYQWEILPTTELLVTIGESALLSGPLPDGRYHSQGTVLSLRLGHRLQL